MNYVHDVTGLADLLERQKTLREQILEQKELILESQSLVKLGDTVIANGYCHAGKSFVVDSIRFAVHDNTNNIIARGLIIKKDGSPGVYQGIREYDILKK